ncbi:DUF2177 family protein [Glaciecola sp. 1036]|uniref:DUF2177 family protein n=1 Tax=Alteromonadaceae TaxID=72275 RepID=UPI003CFBE572
MQLSNVLKVYGITLIVYLLMDAIWLGIVARQDYVDAIGFLMREDVPIWPWVTFYLLYVFVILKLCIFCSNKPSFSRALTHSILLGAASYGAYNLTNYAMLENWPLNITISDWVWGTVVTTTSAMAGFFAYKFFNSKSQTLDSTPS